MKIPIKLLQGAQMPQIMRDGDAGIDLAANEDVTIAPNEQKLVKTGISMAIPTGFVGLIWDRSGVAHKLQTTTMGGVIDSNYRGEIRVILRNFKEEPLLITKGERIAQLLIQPVQFVELKQVAELEESTRNEAGFGSTGMK